MKIQTASVKRVNAILNVTNAAIPQDQRLFLLCVAEPSFTEADLVWLVEKSSVAYMRVLTAINKLLQVTEAAASEAEASFPEQPAKADAL